MDNARWEKKTPNKASKTPNGDMKYPNKAVKTINKAVEMMWSSKQMIVEEVDVRRNDKKLLTMQKGNSQNRAHLTSADTIKGTFGKSVSGMISPKARLPSVAILAGKATYNLITYWEGGYIVWQSFYMFDVTKLFTIVTLTRGLDAHVNWVELNPGLTTSFGGNKRKTRIRRSVGVGVGKSEGGYAKCGLGKGYYTI
ncbi:hypothetical protein POVCU2_0011660 [Plasmodium ovale curtisi]|uniref:Uncharacterized protein n=1 Tax=Plasmodium ovale curtisi TaxID=864141 RepID=A0A1A8VMZ1_PLAOA|nr:hypothetical protein POVCU2_0011660 [Plasmodium ovale curtisi]